jgi:PAS domain S-box-containing protein
MVFMDAARNIRPPSPWNVFMNKDYSILVVDDSANALFFISEMLRNAGYHVECAESGQKALDMCSARAFDLFIIDVLMPNMDGMSLLQRLNTFDNTYEAILTTATGNLEDAQKAMELGAIGYIEKSAAKNNLLPLAAKALQFVATKKKRIELFAALEKKVSDKSSEVDSMARLLEYQGRQIDSIINSMGEGIIAVDSEQSIVLMNRPAELITGLRFAECAGMKLSKAFESLEVTDQLLTLIETGPVPGKERCILPIPQEGGRQKYYYINIQQISNEKGVRTGSVALFMDQTESINAARMRDSFFSIAAHELRTPISIIMNYLALLQGNTESDDKHREVVEGMQSANRRLTVLVNRLIALANLSNHTYAMNRGATDIDRLIQSKIRKITSEADEKNVSIAIENRLTEPMIPMDAYLVKIVLYNLLSNAVKFSRYGGSVRILLEKRHECAHDTLAIAVIDEGDGISDRARNCLFTSFLQGEAPLTRTQGGMGIGLYLAKKAAELMGGDIGVFSEKGKGSTFTLTVPLP